MKIEDLRARVRLEVDSAVAGLVDEVTDRIVALIERDRNELRDRLWSAFDAEFGHADPALYAPSPKHELEALVIDRARFLGQSEDGTMTPAPIASGLVEAPTFLDEPPTAAVGPEASDDEPEIRGPKPKARHVCSECGAPGHNARSCKRTSRSGDPVATAPAPAPSKPDRFAKIEAAAKARVPFALPKPRASFEF